MSWHMSNCFDLDFCFFRALHNLHLRLPQTPQHIPHHQGAVFGFGQVALYAQFVVAGQLDVAVFLDEVDDGHRVDRWIRLEGDVDDARRGIDFDHAVGLGHHTQAVYVKQRLRLRGEFAESIDNFLQQDCQFVQ